MTSAIGTLKGIEGNANAELRINCLLDAAQYFYVAGQAFSAIDPVLAAIELATRVNQRALLRKALTVIGITYADTGNMSRAIECYEQALALVEELNEKHSECSVWLNLGVALLYCALYRDAIACFEHVINLTGGDPVLRHFRAPAFANIALCSLHMEDFGRGLRAAETSVKERGDPTSASEALSRVLAENNYTRLLLEVNSIDRAKERSELARRFAKQSGSLRAELSASIAEGLYEVHAGKVDVGTSRLTSALERARMMRGSMLREVLIALVKAYEIAGQPQRALIYLREMMEVTRNTQQENALKHLRIHLEQLGQAYEGPQVGTTPLERREAALRGKIAEQELFKSRIEMLERLAVTAELRDDSTGEHSYRVGKLSALIANEFGCDEDTCYMIELAARLHDIGKIGVPDAILLKPDKLNLAERQIMRTHTTVGAELLSKSNIPHMQMAEEIARAHHEWWDGTGYPGNLSGSAIPLAARITAIADVYDALTHKRPYKEAWPIAAALVEIESLKGKQFDPQLTDHFLVLISRLRDEHPDVDKFLGQAARSSPFLRARSKIWDTLQRSKNADGTGSDSRLDLQR
ncbi:hypothetical protein BWI17_16305 [Betaproteobacteria bacterium GR16-43]|nr:hypothetical protein BWI17_16305 [Betaproteobacteria bacterium GR16-43]